MQFVKVPQNTTLKQLREIVGSENLETVLNANQLPRTPNIGAQVYYRQKKAISERKDVSVTTKITGLNKATQDADVFETMALMDDNSWKVYAGTDSLPSTIQVPNTVQLSSSENIIGNGDRVNQIIYTAVMKSLQYEPHTVDPYIFSTYSTDATTITDTSQYSVNKDNLFEFFKIPWGKMSIYSSISKKILDFPVYPEEISDGVKANYTTMPELIYQYEPWQLYTSSGPRSNTYTFIFHRDMWTGDHRDGKANELIRFCMAQCYPEYNGSAVNTALTTLYMNGNILMRGVVTDVHTNWEGPLGLDNFPLVCRLSISMIEVSLLPLDYWTEMQKPLIR